MKKLLIAVLCSAALLPAYAQSGKVLSAYNLFFAYQTSNNTDRASLEDAKKNISEAIVHENTKNDSKAWYYNGIINQLLFQDSILKPNYPNSLIEASRSYQKAIEISEQPEASKFRYLDDAIDKLALAAGQLHNFGIIVYESGKDLPLAYEAFNETLAINDFLVKRNQQAKIKVKTDNTRFLAAVTADNLGKKEEAKKLYEQLIVNKYNNVYVYKALAGLYTEAKQPDKAMEVLNQGMKAYPDSASLTIDVLNIYLTTGRQTEAIDIMNKAIQQDPKNAQLYFVLANTYGKMKDEAKTIETYNKALEIDPNYADAYNNLGAIYLDKSNAIIDKQANPKITDAEYQKLENERLGYLKQALPYLEKASALKPSNLEILDALKTIYAKLGDYDKVTEVKNKMAALQKK